MRFLFLVFFQIAVINNTMMPVLRVLDNEVLIATLYKEIDNGYIIFLTTVGDELKEITYSYSINTLNKKVTCSRLREVVYNNSEWKKSMNSFRFNTADEFNKKNKKSWREKYYKCFADDFLDMTNDEKIKLLDKICALKI